MKFQGRNGSIGDHGRIGIARTAACAALVSAGMIVGAAVGEVQPTAPSQHFQSGGQLSVPVLKEIAATLQQMDARLARLETVAQQLRPAKASPLPAVSR
ncbi:MAG TPA: hypothetical protein VH835_06280 [Dongiaceae bacterium]|jgi:hypothetical protein